MELSTNPQGAGMWSKEKTSSFMSVASRGAFA